MSTKSGQAQIGRFDFSAADLEGVSIAKLEEGIDEVWGVVSREQASSGKHAWQTRAFVERCCAEAASRYSIENMEVVGSRRLHVNKYPLRRVPVELVHRVDAALPKQPWPIGIHRVVSEQLACDPRDVSAAIEVLMHSGARNVQKDGLVYDDRGNIVAVDTERHPSALDATSANEDPAEGGSRT